MNQLTNYPEPCPFCGRKSYIAFSDFDGRPYINSFHSKKCKMKPNTWLISSKSINQQLKAWNMRAGD